MLIDENNMFDYINCPAKYYIKYHTKINIKDEISLPFFLTQISNFFFSKLLNGSVPTYNDLKKRWDRICESNKAYLNDKKVLLGWGMIVKMAEWTEQNQLCVGDINTRYILNFDKYSIQGHIPIISVTNDKKIELLYLYYGEHIPDKIDIDMKLKYTLDYMGFYSIYNTYPDIIKIHSVKYNQDYFTTRTKPDMVRLENTVKNISKCIENNLFYPRESTFCKSCASRQYCKYLNIKEVKK